MGEILEVCTRYRGPPCTITSDVESPRGCEMVFELFQKLNERRADLKSQVIPLSIVMQTERVYKGTLSLCTLSLPL